MKRCLNCMKPYDDDLAVCPHCEYKEGTPPKIEYHLTPGVVVGKRYVIGTALGHGGFGITYKAWDLKLETVVAIKEFFPANLVSRIPGMQEVNLQGERKQQPYDREMGKFLQEARTLAKFSSHPNIVHVSNYFEENNTAYMVMEYLDGIDLLRYVKQKPEKKITPKEMVPIIQEVCTALKAIHNEGIIHRDISPDNIRITSNGRVKLLDFGAAKASEIGALGEFTVVIKPGYAPPEQYRKKSKIGSWTDIYALCATMYRLVTGKKPAEASDRQAEECLLAPKELTPELPDWLNRVILRGMALNPEVRFQNIEQLEIALGQQKEVDLPGKVEKRKSMKRTFTFAVVAAICAVVIVVFVFGRNEMSDKGVPDGHITVCLPDTSFNRNAYTAAAQSFEEKFPGKKVKIKFASIFSEESFYEKADVFLASEGEKFGLDFADVNEVYEEIELNDYHFLNDEIIDQQILETVPLSADLYVVIYNKYLAARDEELEELLKNRDNLEMSDLEPYFEDKKRLQASLEYGKLKASDSAITSFCEEKCTVVIARSSTVAQVQEKLAGYYEVKPLAYGWAEFDNVMSINESCTETEKKIAKLWLRYLLSNEGQSILFVQNEGSIPLNRDIFKEYIHVYGNLAVLEKTIEQTQIMK